MSVVLDEVRVGEDGQVDVRIIPSDDVSARAEVLAVFEAGSSPAGMVTERFLPRIAARLRVSGRIACIVHGGEDSYSVLTSDGKAMEFNVARDHGLRDAIGDLADYVASVEMITPKKSTSRAM